jgi:hypothetical protein
VATSKLLLYQDACTVLGERKVSTLAENSVMRRRLDSAWDSGVPRVCLSRGLWNHAMRSVQLDYSPSVEPPFGQRRAFDKPADWVRTAIIARDEYFASALRKREYLDEAEYWFADIDTIFAKFVSDSTDYGMNLGAWPANFSEFVGASLAHKAAKSTTSSSSEADSIEARVKRLLIRARSTDAMDEPTDEIPGGWVAARRGSGSRER